MIDDPRYPVAKNTGTLIRTVQQQQHPYATFMMRFNFRCTRLDPCCEQALPIILLRGLGKLSSLIYCCIRYRYNTKERSLSVARR